jgi:hypothetical protein
MGKGGRRRESARRLFATLKYAGACLAARRKFGKLSSAKIAAPLGVS